MFCASVESTRVAELGRASVAATRVKMACSVRVTRDFVSVDCKGLGAWGPMQVFILRELGCCGAGRGDAEWRVTMHVSTGVTVCQ